MAFSRSGVAPSSFGVTTTRAPLPATSVSGRAKRCFTRSRASVTVRPPTSVPPTFTPATMTFGCGGAGVVVVVGAVVVTVVVVGAVLVVPVVVPSSAPAAVARRSATTTPAAPQDERAAIVTPRFTSPVYLGVLLPPLFLRPRKRFNQPFLAAPAK